MNLDELKAKENITRDDLVKALKAIGKAGIKRKQKKEAIKQLNLKNPQGLKLEDYLMHYEEF